MTEIISNVYQETFPDCIVYYIEGLSTDFKQEIRNRLVSICHGADKKHSDRKIYSYKATVREFVKRYKTNEDNSENRKKGMIGELLVHALLEIDDRFTVASPFFNLEERSFKKGFDVALYEQSTGDLWITEVKSGTKQKNQKDASSAIVGLINTAKNDLYDRLNDNDSSSLWLNAIHAAECAMSKGSNQKDAVITLLEECADNAVEGINTSTAFNVVLAGSLFHPTGERMDSKKVVAKQARVVNENLFQKVLVIAIQKSTFEAVYEFLESEAENEK